MAGGYTGRMASMTRRREELRLLLLQIRDEPRIRREEHESFASCCGLAGTQIEILNVFDRPAPQPGAADGFDALLVGGASEANVLEPRRYPFIAPCMEILLHCADRGTPVFASCFGFQLAVLALDGSILHQDRDFEMGTIPIRLGEAAAGDPLFADIPDDFPAVSVHRQLATEAPAGCETLAFTDACCHAFRIRERPFWAFQFHPEVDRRTLVERLTLFKAHYTDDDGHLDRVLEAACETPESNALPRKFVDRVLLGAPPGYCRAARSMP